MNNTRSPFLRYTTCAITKKIEILIIRQVDYQVDQFIMDVARVCEIALIMQQRAMPRDLVHRTSELCHDQFRTDRIHNIIEVLKNALDIHTGVLSGHYNDILPKNAYLSSIPLTHQQMSQYVIFQYIQQQSQELVDILARSNVKVIYSTVHINYINSLDKVCFFVDLIGDVTADFAMIYQELENSNLRSCTNNSGIAMVQETPVHIMSIGYSGRTADIIYHAHYIIPY